MDSKSIKYLIYVAILIPWEIAFFLLLGII